MAIPRASDFNAMVTLDLKEFGKDYIFWMVCAFTKMIKEVVVKDKKAESIMEGLHRGWYLNYGCPSVGFYAYNGGGFRNLKMEEFVSKIDIKIEFSPAYSP